MDKKWTSATNGSKNDKLFLLPMWDEKWRVDILNSFQS